MFATPQTEHQWLQQLVGDWTSEMTGCGAPGSEPETSTGTERVRSIGGLWTLGEGTGAMPDGSKATTLMTLGYDPAKGRYVGSFVGSMMTHFWLYEGSLSEDGRSLVLEAEGPSFAEENKSARYRDELEITAPDHRVLRSSMLMPDGSWHGFMTAHYRRD